MLGDCRPSVLLTQQALAGMLAGIDHSLPQLVLDSAKPDWARQVEADPEPAAAATNLAYLIYTSGSTGMPQRAMNEHRGVVNLLLWISADHTSELHSLILISYSVFSLYKIYLLFLLSFFFFSLFFF